MNRGGMGMLSHRQALLVYDVSQPAKLLPMLFRKDQASLMVALLGVCWLSMQIVHEIGHVLAGMVTGGSVERVVLHPLAFSRTDFGHNPHPLLSAWGGPLIGSLFPVLLYGLAHWWRLAAGHLFRFFAGFCLIANGVYIGLGVFAQLADAGDLLRAGAAGWHLGFFGLAATGLGLWFWNGLGSAFGLGAPIPPNTDTTARQLWIVLALILAAELWLGY